MPNTQNKVAKQSCPSRILPCHRRHHRQHHLTRRKRQIFTQTRCRYRVSMLAPVAMVEAALVPAAEQQCPCQCQCQCHWQFQCQWKRQFQWQWPNQWPSRTHGDASRRRAAAAAARDQNRAPAETGYKGESTKGVTHGWLRH